MGMYVNPGNQAFAAVRDADYVDMTGLIRLINQTIGKKDRLTCISRPRRFGKSWNASMLTAYYDCSCDSHPLFDHLQISRTKEYATFLNQYNVVYLDISGFISSARREGISCREIPRIIVESLQRELLSLDSDIAADQSLEEMMLAIVGKPKGKQFVFIIDEWDAIIREAKKDHEAQERYLNLLRGWFKNQNFTPKVVAAAYMTGILPIKKDGSQSAISDFREYSMLYPGQFAKYTGFSENAVKRICRKHKMNFEQMKEWYDGYELAGNMSVYNPYSVMSAVGEGECRSFWGKTSAAESMTDYIRMDFQGLQETVASLIAGAQVEVNPEGFQNDFERFRTKDDILTLLVHLGYLTYDKAGGTVHIPNKEVRQEFIKFLQEDDTGKYWAGIIARSRKLLDDTFAGNEEAVAAAMEEIRHENYAPQYYNNEQSLRAVIKYAYLAAVGRYARVDEMPSGKGIADIVFIPTGASRLPAMVIELKWNQTAGGALEQIKKNGYTAALEPYQGNLLLIGINYDVKSGKHTCKIERV